MKATLDEKDRWVLNILDFSNFPSLVPHGHFFITVT